MTWMSWLGVDDASAGVATIGEAESSDRGTPPAIPLCMQTLLAIQNTVSRSSMKSLLSICDVRIQAAILGLDQGVVDAELASLAKSGRVNLTRGERTCAPEDEIAGGLELSGELYLHVSMA